MPVTAQAAWPRQTSLELLALPSAVPCVRGHVRAVAAGWGSYREEAGKVVWARVSA
jgi:hypothetical protein